MYSTLIIEGVPICFSIMETILQNEGFEVRTASDVQSGLAMLCEKLPDVILRDIMMPAMDGHMILETLKGERALANIPFIFVTALGDRADVRLGMSAGADDYLSKPSHRSTTLPCRSTRLPPPPKNRPPRRVRFPAHDAVHRSRAEDLARGSRIGHVSATAEW